MKSEELWFDIVCVAARLKAANGTVDDSTPMSCQRIISESAARLPYRPCRRSGYRTGAVTGLEMVCRQRAQRMRETIEGIGADTTTSLCINSCNRMHETPQCHRPHLRSAEKP